MEKEDVAILRELFDKTNRNMNLLSRRIKFEKCRKICEALGNIEFIRDMNTSVEEIYRIYLNLQTFSNPAEIKSFTKEGNFEVLETLLIKMFELDPKSEESNDLRETPKEDTEQLVKVSRGSFNNGTLNSLQEITRLGLTGTKEEIFELYERYAEIIYTTYIDNPTLPKDAYRSENLDEFRKYLLNQESLDSEEKKEISKIIKSIAFYGLKKMLTVYSVDELRDNEETIKKDFQLGLYRRMIGGPQFYTREMSPKEYSEKREDYRKLADEWDEYDLENYEKLKACFDASFEYLLMFENKYGEGILEVFEHLDKVIEHRGEVKEIMEDAVLGYEEYIRTDMLKKVYEVPSAKKCTMKFGEEEIAFDGIVVDPREIKSPMLCHYTNFRGTNKENSWIFLFNFLKKQIGDIESYRRSITQAEIERNNEIISNPKIWLSLMKFGDISILLAAVGMNDIDLLLAAEGKNAINISADEREIFIENINRKKEVFLKNVEQNKEVKECIEIIKKYIGDDEFKGVLAKYIYMIKDPAVIHGVTQKQHICTKFLNLGNLCQGDIKKAQYGLIFDQNGIQNPESILVLANDNLESQGSVINMSDTTNLNRRSANFNALMEASQNGGNTEIDIERENTKPSGVFYIPNTTSAFDIKTFKEALAMAEKNGLPLVWVDVFTPRENQLSLAQENKRKDNDAFEI